MTEKFKANCVFPIQRWRTPRLRSITCSVSTQNGPFWSTRRIANTQFRDAARAGTQQLLLISNAARLILSARTESLPLLTARCGNTEFQWLCIESATSFLIQFCSSEASFCLLFHHFWQRLLKLKQGLHAFPGQREGSIRCRVSSRSCHFWNHSGAHTAINPPPKPEWTALPQSARTARNGVAETTVRGSAYS